METKDREHRIYFVTLMGSVVNVVLLVFKFIAGILGGSAAMIADAVHSLSDFMTDIVVLLFVKISSKPEDKDHDYGHGKYETLATSMIGVALLCVGLYILYSGAYRMWTAFKGSPIEQPGIVALWAALFSIVMKEWTYRFTAKVGKEVESQAVVANAWHHRSDALSSIGSLLGIAGAIFLGKQYVILDPLAACVISIFIIVMSVKMSIPAIKELLEVSLPKEKEARIAEIIRSVSGVVGLHELKTRQVGSGIVMDAHLVMDSELSLRQAHDISKNVEAALHAEYGDNIQISLHLEPEDDSE